MAKEYKTVEIDLGQSKTGILSLPADVVDYFKIPTSTAAATARERKRKSYTRRVYTGLNDATGKSVAVQASTWTDTPSPPKRGAGKAVKVPTELKTQAGSVRMVTMNFPSGAVIGAISKFLFTKCTSHKPTYFVTSNGVRHAVLNVTGNVNPDPTPTPDTTPAA